MSLSTIVIESGGVFAHNLNQDGSGNVGVNVENFPATQPVSGTVAVSNFPATQPVSGPALATVNLGDTGTYTAGFNGVTQTNTNAKGVMVFVGLGSVSGVSNLVASLQWSPDGGTTWFTFNNANISFSNQTCTLMVYPTAFASGVSFGCSATANLNAPLPETWRTAYTVTGASPSFQINTANYRYLY